jgi:hypothetical protein
MQSRNEKRRIRYNNDQEYRNLILGRAKAAYKKWRQENPIKPKRLLTYKEKRERANKRKHRAYWAGYRERLMQQRNTPEFRAKNNSRRRKLYASSAAFRKRSLEANKKAMKKRKAIDPMFCFYLRLRDRMTKAVKRALISGKSLKSQDREGANFLVWLSKQQGILDVKKYHIDHLIPVSLWEKSNAPYGLNSPENVRWMLANDNILKKDTMPSHEVLAQHKQLVNDWRNQ